MNESSEADLPLERIDWPALPKPPADLRREVLQKTTRLVRRRAWRRRLRLTAGWGLAYAAGLVSAWFALRHEAPAPAQRQEASVRQIAINQVVPSMIKDDLDALPPEELRRRVAGAPRPEQIRLLRMAGDRYLFGAADVESALDCYRQVIELTPRSELAGSDSGDSWLLAELKSSAAGVDGRLAVE
jgi:hypothetical protein